MSLLTIDFIDGRLTYNIFFEKDGMALKCWIMEILEMLDQHILSGSYLKMC